MCPPTARTRFTLFTAEPGFWTRTSQGNGHRPPSRPPHPGGPPGAPSEEEQELCYASLSISKGTPRTHQGQEASVYSEVALSAADCLCPGCGWGAPVGGRRGQGCCSTSQVHRTAPAPQELPGSKSSGTDRDGDICGSQAPSPEYQLKVPRVVTVPQGLCVRVSCDLRYPQQGWTESTPAQGYWFRYTESLQWDYKTLVATNDPAQQWRTQYRFQLVGEPQNFDCSLLVREAQLEDSAVYFFRLERGTHVKYSFLDFRLRLEVTEQIPKPALYMPETLEPGHQVPIVCVFNWTFEGCPGFPFSWRGSPALSAPRTSHSYPQFSVLTLTPRLQDHNTALTCQVDFTGVSTERTVQLHVAHAPRTLTISISQANTSAPERHPQGSWEQRLDVRKGQFLQLLCAANGWPPATLSWALGDRVLAWSPPSGSRALALVLPQVKAEDAGRYTCRAENRLGAGSRQLDLAVQYGPEDLRIMVSPANRTDPPRLLGPSCSPEDDGGLLCLCSARARPAPALRWRLGEQLLAGNSSNASVGVTFSPGGLWANSSLRLRGGLGAALRLCCEAQNPHGTGSTTLLLQPDEKGLLSKTFSHGILLGIGVMTLLFGLILILVRTLRKKGPPADRVTRRSTILDYINVIPRAGPLARSRRPKPSGPSQPPPPSAVSPESKGNQELHFIAHSRPGPRSPIQAPEADPKQEEVHYATLNFPGLRPRDTPAPRTSNSEYAEVRFH
ncbi:PREDICTED: sialic acid-binding Ig-like lectin 10 [Condylura cristata]|uniref:sialic acid-binding Ig-like lectin 10 n=1 Tax=Condylura cristata TaxID=143302 RepID=UPI000642F79B|nr:PREDICTED: sialic acid-binding Ig-like lectin 10 [Condylura cristata]